MRPGHPIDWHPTGTRPNTSLCGWINFLFGFSCAMTWYGSSWWMLPVVILAVLNEIYSSTGW